MTTDHDTATGRGETMTDHATATKKERSQWREDVQTEVDYLSAFVARLRLQLHPDATAEIDCAIEHLESAAREIMR